MAITPVRLRKVITGTKQKYFDLDVLDGEGNIVGRRLYIANIEKNSNNVKEILELSENTPPSQLTNTCNIFSSAGGVKDLVIRNMFEVTDNTDFETRSYAYTNKTDLEFNKADDYSDLFIDNRYQLSSIIGFNDSVFTLTNTLSSITYYPLEYITKDNILSTAIIRDPLFTAIFNPVSSLENLSTTEFNKKFVPKYLINGLRYNNVIDYPMSVYPLFKDNTLLGNAIICKNHLGYDYSQHSVETQLGEGLATRKFTEMRSYKRLITSGDNVYLVYDNNYYIDDPNRTIETVPYINNTDNTDIIVNIIGAEDYDPNFPFDDSINITPTPDDPNPNPDPEPEPSVPDVYYTEVKYTNDSTKVFLIEGAITGIGGSPTIQLDGEEEGQTIQNVKEIKIGQAVTSIGGAAFTRCTSLTTITIPSSVTTIGNSVFKGCTGLTTITIPSSVTTIGDSAFEECSNLTPITIPSSVTTIGNSVFKGCTGLTTITIPDSVISIGYGVFRSCSSLTSVTIPRGVTNISKETFYNCPRLISITIPPHVISIGSSAFYGCTSLTYMIIPEAVTSIGERAFEGCSGLTYMIIPETVTSIGNYGFYNCSSLTSITFEGIPPIADTTSFPTANTTLIGYYLPEKAEEWEAVITDGKWKEMTMRLKGIMPEDYTVVTYLNGTTASFLIEGAITGIDGTPDSPTIQLNGEEEGQTIQNAINIRIGTKVTSIGDLAFYDCTKLVSVTIPSTVTSIGDAAFASCWSLNTITIPEGVETIGDYVFRNCWSLNTITIPSTVTEIGNYGFEYCYSLTAFVVNSANQHYKVMNSLLCSKDGKTVIACPGGLTSVTIPEGVETIGEGTFYRCEGLTAITIPSSVTEIGDYAFYGCSSLTSIEIPEGVKIIGDWAFDFCRSLISITIPSSMESIGQFAFYECSKLISITFEGLPPIAYESSFPTGNTTLIGYYLTKNKMAWEAVITNNKWNNLTMQEYTDARFTQITYSDGTTASLLITGELVGAFKSPTPLIDNVKNATTIRIGTEVTSIGDYAFFGCNKLTLVEIPPTVNKIGIWAFGSCWKLINLTIPNGVTTISDNMFNGCTNLTSITIPSSVTKIGYKAFYQCYSLAEVEIPASVTEIGEAAFSGCSNLTTITIPEWEGGLKTIGKQAFEGCSGLTSVTINDSDIGYRAFYGCARLTEVTIDGGVIGNYAFDNCDNLTTATIKSGVIGNYAFYECSRLTEVTINEGVTSIGGNSFAWCSSLTTVTIPASVTSIGDNAFYSCSKLETIYFNGNPPNMNFTAFITYRGDSFVVGYYKQGYKDKWEELLGGNSSGLLYSTLYIRPNPNKSMPAPATYSVRSSNIINTGDITPTIHLNTIEKVEQFNSVNRFTQANHHKSNLYSIEIEDLGLNAIEKTADEKIKTAVKNIKKSITNNIKKICKNTQPGNTQLFSVFFTGN